MKHIHLKGVIDAITKSKTGKVYIEFNTVIIVSIMKNRVHIPEYFSVETIVHLHVYVIWERNISITEEDHKHSADQMEMTKPII